MFKEVPVGLYHVLSIFSHPTHPNSNKKQWQLCIAELQFRFQDECGTGVPRYDFLKNNSCYVKTMNVNIVN